VSGLLCERRHSNFARAALRATVALTYAGARRDAGKGFTPIASPEEEMTGVLSLKLTLCICTLVVIVRTLAQAINAAHRLTIRRTVHAAVSSPSAQRSPDCRCRSKSLVSRKYHLAARGRRSAITTPVAVRLPLHLQ
jgi:hypothetical protein